MKYRVEDIASENNSFQLFFLSFNQQSKQLVCNCIVSKSQPLKKVPENIVLLFLAAISEDILYW